MRQHRYHSVIGRLDVVPTSSYHLSKKKFYKVLEARVSYLREHVRIREYIEEPSVDQRRILQVALRRLNSVSDDFDICRRCHGRINHERLEVIPETELCIACQREVERYSVPEESETYISDDVIQMWQFISE